MSSVGGSMPMTEPNKEPSGDERGPSSDVLFESFWDWQLRRIKERAESKNSSQLPDNNREDDSSE
jgi:hypothetical protein